MFPGRADGFASRFGAHGRRVLAAPAVDVIDRFGPRGSGRRKTAPRSNPSMYWGKTMNFLRLVGRSLYPRHDIGSTAGRCVDHNRVRSTCAFLDRTQDIDGAERSDHRSEVRIAGHIDFLAAHQVQSGGWPLQQLNADYPNPWVRSELVRIGRLPEAPSRSSSKTRKSSSARRRGWLILRHRTRIRPSGGRRPL